MDAKHDLVHHNSSPEAKIALFRSLFRGRDDVYPRRFQSRRSGKAGYQPACGNEWAVGVCEKPKVKCAECPRRRFLSVTDEVIRWHLSGRDAEGREQARQERRAEHQPLGVDADLLGPTHAEGEGVEAMGPGAHRNPGQRGDRGHRDQM